MKKILVVDDHPVMRKFLADHLGKRGHEVIVADDGLSALELLGTVVPDILFVDLVMPRINGEKLCRIIRRRPELNGTFLVVFSAVVVEENAPFENTPADAYIAKGPFRKLSGFVDSVVEDIENGRGDQIKGRIYGAENLQEREISRELLASTRHYEKILDKMSEGLLELTDQEKVIFANPAAQEIVGVEEERLLSADFQGFFSERGWKKVWEGIQKAKHKNREIDTESEIRFNRNRVSLKLIPVQKNGCASGMLVMLKDITRRKRLESQLRQAEKMEAIGNLAGGIAHDLNNILTPIFGYTEMAIQDLPRDSLTAKNLRNVISAANRARELVQQILQFSRRNEEDVKPIKIQFVLKETLKLLNATIPATIEIKENIDPYCDAVMADAFQIQQIAMNLCTNAFHAMMETGGELSISLYQAEKTPFDAPAGQNKTTEPWVVFEVADSGSGIDPSVIEKIFDPYFTTKQLGKGTGLGLSVVHGIVRKSNGHLTVDSKPGKGSTFRVYLPAVKADDAVPGTDATFPDMPRGREKILIVDDDNVIADMYREVLAGAGYRVTVFMDSRDALDAVQCDPGGFDLVVTDMTMPGKTGAELAAGILEITPDMPIILNTGFNEPLSEKKARQLGIRKYLIKPVSIVDLANAVREVLDES